MDKEDFVSLEVAELLKEKGYDIPTKAFVLLNDNNSYKRGDIFYLDTAYQFNLPNTLPIPTLYEAQKWLICNNKYAVALPTKENGLVEWIGIIASDELDYLPNYFKTYQQALNSAILEALKLID